MPHTPQVSPRLKLQRVLCSGEPPQQTALTPKLPQSEVVSPLSAEGQSVAEASPGGGDTRMLAEILRGSLSMPAPAAPVRHNTRAAAVGGLASPSHGRGITPSVGCVLPPLVKASEARLLADAEPRTPPKAKPVPLFLRMERKFEQHEQDHLSRELKLRQAPVPQSGYTKTRRRQRRSKSRRANDSARLRLPELVVEAVPAHMSPPGEEKAQRRAVSLGNKVRAGRAAKGQRSKKGGANARKRSRKPKVLDAHAASAVELVDAASKLQGKLPPIL